MRMVSQDKLGMKLFMRMVSQDKLGMKMRTSGYEWYTLNQVAGLCPRIAGVEMERQHTDQTLSCSCSCAVR